MLKSGWLLYAFLSAFFAALTTILVKLGVQGVSSNLATAVRTVVILILAWVWVFTTGEVKGLSAIPQRTMLFLLLSGVATGLSWLFYFRALQEGQTALVAAIDKSSLLLVVVLAALFLHEPLTWRSTVGALLMVGGILVISL
jgi:transporter family protein